MSRQSVFNEIDSERLRQEEEHPENDALVSEYLAILVEEIGEVARAIQERTDDGLREELIHVASVAVRWIEVLDMEHYSEMEEDYGERS